MIKCQSEVIFRYLANAVLAAACVYFSLLSVFHHLDSDFVSYVGWYGNLAPHDWNSCDGFEPIFCLIGFIYQDSKLPFEYFAFSTSLTIYVCLHLTICKVYRQRGVLGLTTFFSTCLFLYIVFPPEMVSHLIRQYLAIGLILLALASAGKPRLLFALLALGFHFTAIVFLPFILIAYLKLSRIHILIFSIASLSLAFIFSSLIYSILKDFSSSHIDTVLPGGAIYDLLYKVQLYFDGGETRVSRFKLSLLLIAVGYAVARPPDIYSNISILCFVVTLSFMLFSISTSSIMFERFYQYGKALAFFVGLLFVSDVARFRRRLIERVR